MLTAGLVVFMVEVIIWLISSIVGFFYTLKNWKHRRRAYQELKKNKINGSTLIIASDSLLLEQRTLQYFALSFLILIISFAFDDPTARNRKLTITNHFGPISLILMNLITMDKSRIRRRLTVSVANYLNPPRRRREDREGSGENSGRKAEKSETEKGIDKSNESEGKPGDEPGSEPGNEPAIEGGRDE